MSANPYAPPRSEVDDVLGDGKVAPALWNPGAAAGWSLVLSPAFGAFLHMRNWQALGQPDKAAASRTWVIVSMSVLLCVAVASAFFPDAKAYDGVSRIVGLALLLSWYYASGKAQVALVKARYGKAYPKKGWALPLFAAFGVFVVFVIVAIGIGMLGSVVAR